MLIDGNEVPDAIQVNVVALLSRFGSAEWVDLYWRSVDCSSVPVERCAAYATAGCDACSALSGPVCS